MLRSMIRRSTALLLLVLAGLALAGCSKCDFSWPSWPGSALACHSGAQVG
jgi:hypothetical protein